MNDNRFWLAFLGVAVVCVAIYVGVFILGARLVEGICKTYLGGC